MDKEYTCEECDAEFNVEHDFIASVEFCPFCGNKMQYDDSDLDEDWDETE